MGVGDLIERLTGYNLEAQLSVPLDEVQLTGVQKQTKKFFEIKAGTAPDSRTVALIKATTSGLGTTATDYVALTKKDLEAIVNATKEILQR